eukprot:gene5304-8922_t
MYWYSYKEKEPPKLILPQKMPENTSNVSSTQIENYLLELKKPRKERVPWFLQQQQKEEEERKKEVRKQKIQRARAKAKKIAEQKKKQVEFDKTHPESQDSSAPEKDDEEMKEPKDKKKHIEDIKKSMKSAIQPVIQNERINEFKFSITTDEKEEKNQQENDPQKNKEIYKNQSELPNYLKNYYFKSEFQEKKILKFVKDSWVEQKTNDEIVNLKELTIMTFNVWFDRFYFKDRVSEIISILKSSSAHVVCLQEVIPQFIKILTEDDWIKKTCYISDSNGTNMRLYGLLTISTIPIESFTIQTLPTMQGRNCQISNLKINNKTIKIANVHLESLNSRDLRETQLFLIQNFLKNDHSIILGDFNFDSNRNYNLEEKPLENDVLSKYGLEDYTDSWKELYPDNEGFTFDSENNSNIEQIERMRYDRIIVKKSKIWKLKEMKLIGDSYISDDIPIYPSDHFGLSLTIEIDQ